MAEITAAMVKALREETGLGMMDCRNALSETKGNVQAAKDLLRKKGLTTAEKKAGRATKEGLVAIVMSPDGKAAAMIEVQCETDFCSRNDEFRSMVRALADMAVKAPAGEITATTEMTARVQATLAKIGENMGYTRGIKIAAPRIGSYIHHNGKVGVLVGVDGEVSDQVLSELCMHIAFNNPLAISKQDVPADLVAKEREFAKHEAMQSGKPENIAEKMVVGKVNKFLAANALLEQPFVKDETRTVQQVLGAAKVLSFARFAVGA